MGTTWRRASKHDSIKKGSRGERREARDDLAKQPSDGQGMDLAPHQEAFLTLEISHSPGTLAIAAPFPHLIPFRLSNVALLSHRMMVA